MDGSFTDQFLAHLTDSAQVGGVWRYAWTEQIIDPSTGVASDAPSARTGTTSSGYAQEINNLSLPTPFYAMIRLRTLLLGAPVYDFQVGAAAEIVFLRLSGLPGQDCPHTLLDGYIQSFTFDSPDGSGSGSSSGSDCPAAFDQEEVDVFDLNTIPIVPGSS